MSDLIGGFKDCAHQAGEICNYAATRLIREFGLEDFLVNIVAEEDDPPTIALKCLSYFCADPDPHTPVFRFAVLTVGIFLNHYHSGRRRDIPQQALRDLVSLLVDHAPADQLRRWIESNFT